MISSMQAARFLVFVLFSLSFSPVSQSSFINFTNVEAKFGKTESGVVSFNNGVIYYFRERLQENTSRIPTRIVVHSTASTMDYPMIVTVYQLRNSLDFHVPLRLRSNDSFVYPTVSRTLCRPQYMTDHLAVGDSFPTSLGPSPVVTQELVVQVLTMNPAPTSFSLSATPVSNFRRPLNERLTIDISPSTPQFFEFHFPKVDEPLGFSGDQDYVVVRARSDDLVCAYFAVQRVRCPPYDLDRQVEFSYSFATITQQGAIVAMRSAFEADGGHFNIIFAAQAENTICGDPNIYNSTIFGNETLSKFQIGASRRLADSDWSNISAATCVQCKRITFWVERGVPVNDYILPVIAPLAFYSVFFLLCLLIPKLPSYATITDEQRPCLTDSRSQTQTQSQVEIAPSASALNLSLASEANSTLAIANGEDNVAPRPETRQNSELQTMRNYSTIVNVRKREVTETTDRTVSMSVEGATRLQLLRTQVSVTVADLSSSERERLDRRFGIYLNYIIVVAVFYGLPVVQLVLTYQQAVHSSGNQDICYYNYACTRPLGVFVAFNNVYSNIGYALLGVLFLFITAERDTLYRRRIASKPWLADCGVPQHFGLLYTMAVALIMEGVCSACYHICPNYQNFQFDSAFMYMLGGMFILRLYQNRHADRHASAHRTFLILAGVIFASVLGVVIESAAFWIIFTVLAGILVLYLALTVYYMNTFEFSLQFAREMFRLVEPNNLHASANASASETQQADMNSTASSSTQPESGEVRISSPPFKWRIAIRSKRRFFLVCLFVAFNFAVLIFGVSTMSTDFDTFLISLFIGNSVLYTIIYGLMKLLTGERPRFHTWLFFIVMLATAVPAAYFFFSNVSNWYLSPAESRVINRDCVLLNFYDNHDLWHFLSAITIFCICMLYLTFDDDLCTVPRDRIHVF